MGRNLGSGDTTGSGGRGRPDGWCKRKRHAPQHLRECRQNWNCHMSLLYSIENRISKPKLQHAERPRYYNMQVPDMLATTIGEVAKLVGGAQSRICPSRACSQIAGLMGSSGARARASIRLRDRSPSINPASVEFRRHMFKANI